MEKIGMPLLVHGESPQADVDVFDRETHFIDACCSRCSSASQACAWCSNTSPPNARWNSWQAPGPASPRPSRPSTCCTIETRFFRRHPAALLLPADIEARARPTGAARRARPAAIRGFFWAPTARRTSGRQGECLRLRRHVHGSRRHRAVRRGLRIGGPPRPPGGLCQPFRRRFLRPAAPRRHALPWSRSPGCRPQTYEFGDGALVPYRGGRGGRVAARGVRPS